MLEVRPDHDDKTRREASASGFLSATKQRDVNRVQQQLNKSSNVRGKDRSTGTRASGTATQADTNLARQGSNFGLPIALNLTMLMEGGIGIVEVLELCSLIPA